MKRIKLCLLTSVLAILALSLNVYAQGGPPGCCDSTKPIGSSGDIQTSTSNDLYVSRGLLRTLQLSRGDMLDRFSDMLFAGKNVELVISSTRFLTQPKEVADSGEEDLLVVQEKRYYRVPRSRVTAEELETMDEVFLTDGTAFVKVMFGDSASIR
jgi:hypothetical protein